MQQKHNRAAWVFRDIPSDVLNLNVLCENRLTIQLQWRQNERDGVSNHQPHDCLLNRLFSLSDQRKHQSFASLVFVWGIHRDRCIPRTKGQ